MSAIRRLLVRLRLVPAEAPPASPAATLLPCLECGRPTADPLICDDCWGPIEAAIDRECEGEVRP